ncbi:hypothetical protein QYM36_012163 [Artemia franciscana]|uniref:Protein kinase domain-containing protein n=1 Tax=Artemia franciscana TaxID=6661 RepID=A0AA88HNI3_ARTSF|nr:hypothetical protein QYM36_012163 [Artemia franciscana]
MQSEIDTQPIDTQAVEESLPDNAPQNYVEPFAFLLPDSSNFKFAEIRSTVFTIGRHNSNFDITAEQCGEEILKYISKKQCIIHVVFEDENDLNFRLDNVGTNPVFVKGVKILKGRSTLLGHDDTISFGRAKWKAWKFSCNRDRPVSHPEEVVSKYIVAAELGRGANGVVYKAFHKATSEAVALKVLKLSKASKSGFMKTKDLYNEIKVMKKINHPENILLQSKCEEPLAKLTDFGLSKYAPEDLTALKTFCGTMNYVAPEILRHKGKKEYTPQVDVWSLGVVLYVCLAGYPPFSDDYRDEPISEQIIHGNLHMSPKYWSTISGQGQHLVRSMLTVSAVSRLSVSGVLKHPWFSNDSSLFERYEDLIGKLPFFDTSSIQSVPLLESHLTASVSSHESDIVFRRHVKRRNKENIENNPKKAKVC